LVALLLAFSVSTLVDAVGLVANEAVTPLGNPDAASVALPLNPSTSVTVMVSVALPPCITDRVLAEAESAGINGNWIPASRDCFNALTGVAS
jgi:hypothetical protein